MHHSDPSIEETALLVRVANGDEAAFRQLFYQWHQVLAGYVFRLTRSQEITEEIVQDVFLKIWLVRESLTEVKNFKAYLLVVSRNQAYDAMKRQLKEEVRKRFAAKELTALCFPEEDAFLHSWRTTIDKAIDQLPERRKEVYLLSRYEGLTYHEIGERLGISRESVKTHLKLASGFIARFMQSKKHELILLFFFFLKKF